ncbi:ATP-dependent helicase, partial [Candidatus Micrarchaeota archaeon]|nr:ATP-dependent helicase [Candidatus Micrarchaeota archaeon]MBU1929903.1 ATP-dependent helicase [Candidatus Micrarchaeota archaeon]
KFYVSTFHRFCSVFIRENYRYFANYKGYKTLDEYDQHLFLVKFSKKIKENGTKLSISKLTNYFGRLKDNFSIDEIKQKDFPLKEPYIKYCELLSENEYFDFGDLINTVIKEIKLNPELRKFSKNKFEYILIDEYQDINRVQEKLLKLFLGEKTKLWVVGDRNQSIYGFRGSDLTIFDRFCDSFKNSKTYFLRKNYRSTKQIIDFSNKFLCLNENERIIGNYDSLDGEKTSTGTKIKVKQFSSREKEISNLVKYIKDLYKTGIISNYSNVGILLKSVKRYAGKLIPEFEKQKVPFEVIGDGGLFELDYMKEILKVLKDFEETGNIKNDFLGLSIPVIVVQKVRNPLKAFYEIISASKFLKSKIKENDEKIISNLAKFSKLISSHIATFGTSSEEFYKYIIKTEKAFLDIESPIGCIENSVKIMTFHRSKGLEFPIVIIPRLEDNFTPYNSQDELKELFPDYNSAEDFNRAKYVAITRAKDELVFSYSKLVKEITKILAFNDLVYVESNEAANLTTFFEEDKKLLIRPNKHKKSLIELTYYKIEEYLNCPYSYKLRHYNEFAVPRSFQLTYGSTLHNLLYHLNLRIAKKKGVGLGKLIEEKLPKYSNFNPNRFKKLLENYLRDFEKELNNYKIIPEKPFEVPVPGGIFRGKIDLVLEISTNEKIICEFKSGKHNKYSEDKAKRQLMEYAMALKDAAIKKGILYFFGSSSKIEFNLNEPMTLNFQNIITKIKAKDFTPNSKNCKIVGECKFSVICPFFNGKAQQLERIDEQYEDGIEFDEYI